MSPIGWCSATYIFDSAIDAAIDLIAHIQSDDSPSGQDNALKNFAKAMRDELESDDWDCQNDSRYYDDFKWDLWPKWAKEEQDELEQEDQ